MRRLFVIAGAMALLVGCSRTEEVPDTTLALVNGTPINLAEYRKGYTEYLFQGGLPDEPQRRSAFLNRMIAVELIVAEARDEGIEQTEDYTAAAERARQKVLLEALLADQVFSRVQVTEADLEEMFVRANTQITARHLFAPTLEEARRVKSRLDDGERFEDLAAELFSDPVLAENGGLVGTFSFDEMDPAFEDAAFSLGIGDTSDPVRTSQGFSIIRVEDRFTQPVLTESEFVQRQADLAGFVRSRKEELARRAYLDALVEAADVRIDPAQAAQLMGQIAGGAPADDMMEGDEGVLVRFSGEVGEVAWTIEDLRRVAEFTSERQRLAVDNETDLRAFIEGLAARHIMLARAEPLASDSRVEAAHESAMEEWIYERAFNSLLDGMAVSEEEVHAYFDEYADEFVQPRRVRIAEIVTATQPTADSIRQALSTASFEELARRHSLRPASAAVGGDLGYYTHAELGPWGDDVFTAARGDVIGPRATAGRFLLIRVGDVQDERPLTFDEAREQAEAMLRRERQQSYLRSHVQALRQRYPVRIVVDSLDGLVLTGSAHA